MLNQNCEVIVMKKRYISPRVDIIEIEVPQIIAASSTESMLLNKSVEVDTYADDAQLGRDGIGGSAGGWDYEW